MPTVSGNVGGTAGSGAQISIRSTNGDYAAKTSADSSGDWSFTVADEREYVVTAALGGFTIRHQADVSVRGGNNVGAVNFPIAALNGSNSSL